MTKLPAIAGWAEEPPFRTLFCLPCVLHHSVALAAAQAESVVDSSTSHHLIRSNPTLQTEEIHLLCLKDPPATPWAAIWGSGSRLDITSDIYLIWCEHTYIRPCVLARLPHKNRLVQTAEAGSSCNLPSAFLFPPLSKSCSSTQAENTF